MGYPSRHRPSLVLPPEAAPDYPARVMSLELRPAPFLRTFRGRREMTILKNSFTRKMPPGGPTVRRCLDGIPLRANALSPADIGACAFHPQKVAFVERPTIWGRSASLVCKVRKLPSGTATSLVLRQPHTHESKRRFLNIQFP